MEDVLVYLKSINWELLVTAILALVALRTSHFSIKSFYENQKSKRAFLAPDSDPGFFKIPNSNYDVFAKTVIKNFGTNPASKIISYVHFIAETQVKTEKKEMKRSLVHSFTLYSNSVNPIPNGVIFESAFKQKYFKENLILNDPIVPITFICQKLIYFDRVLEEEFTDTFYWTVGENPLQECWSNDKDEIDKLALSKHETEAHTKMFEKSVSKVSR